MSLSPNNSTYDDTIHDPPLSASKCIPWLAVFGAECLTIVILNVIIIIAFVKQRQLQRRSTCLIIHQAVVDLLVGLLYGSLIIEGYGGFFCVLWEYHRPNITWLYILELVLGQDVYQVSLLNLAVISLERVHATIRPFKHRFIKKWVYGVMITIIWLVPSVTNSVIIEVLPSTRFYDFFKMISFAYYCTLIFVVVVCYIIIYLKVRCVRRPQHHGAAVLRERKLTSTLFLVTFGSLITFLPMMVFWGFEASNSELSYSFSHESFFHVMMVKTTFVAANSLINPIIYAIRMPEVKTVLTKIIFRSASNPLNTIDIPLQNL